MLDEWLPYGEPWQLRLKRGYIFIFSDSESTMLTYYVSWSARKKSSLKSKANLSGFLFVDDQSGLSLKLTNCDWFQIFVHDTHTEQNRLKLLQILRASEPAQPIFGEPAVAKEEFVWDIRIEPTQC